MVATPATAVQRFDSAQLRAALCGLAASPQFLGSPNGLAFVRQLELYLAPSMLAMARRAGIDGSWVHTHEVVNTVLIGLCAQDGRVARHIASTSIDPWGYLAKCSVQWVRALWGTRGTSLEASDFIVVGAEPTEDRLTPTEDVARLVHAQLWPHTESRLQRPLLPLLHWLAENPPQRISHESSDRAAAASQFPAFTIAQVAAVTNIAWGSRPKRRDTSLMAALLLDHAFHPADSPSHARALLQYRRAMRSRSLVTQYPELQRRLAA